MYYSFISLIISFVKKKSWCFLPVKLTAQGPKNLLNMDIVFFRDSF